MDLSHVLAIEGRVAAAAPHLPKCEIMASRREGTMADWTTVADLVRAAPSDLEWATAQIRELGAILLELREAHRMDHEPGCLRSVCGCAHSKRLVAAYDRRNEAIAALEAIACNDYTVSNE